MSFAEVLKEENVFLKIYRCKAESSSVFQNGAIIES